MLINNHRLNGDNISYRESPNKGGMITPTYLVFHFTAGHSSKSSVDWLCNPGAKASAHLVVGRGGDITQLVPFNTAAWHAGKSSWAGLTGLNQYSIGIEMDNAGKLTKTGSTYKTWFNTVIPEDEVVQAKHKFEPDLGFWHAYTDIQIERALELATLLGETYSIKDIIGHDDIAPHRKNDPGPAFPLANIRSKVFGRSDEQNDIYEVTVDDLNIRKGPGTEFDTVGQALAKGTQLTLIEARDRWSKVDVNGENDVEGWVYNKYITHVS